MNDAHSKRRRLVALLACAALLTACATTANRPPQLRRDGLFVYPSAALAARIEGTVMVAFDIDANGRVEAPKVVSATPAEVFDAAAVTYVAGRVYEPARKNGQRAAVIGQRARINFKLGDASGYADD